MLPYIERNRVRAFIMQELLNGNINIGDRLSLPAIAAQLQCSVTPVREALTQLEYNKVIEAVPNRGFIIPELDASEAAHLYDLIAALEVLALENTVFTAVDIKQLKKLHKIFSAGGDANAKIEADMNLHEALTKSYSNPFAQQTIRDLKIRIFFYEKSYMANEDLTAISVQQHRKIIEAVENGDKRKAAKILKQNWAVMLAYIHQRMGDGPPCL
jgi:DNA-binding GntR family transcriptional regulator